MAGWLVGWLAGWLAAAVGWLVGWLAVESSLGRWGDGDERDGGGAAMEHGVCGADEGGVDGGAEEKLALRGEAAAATGGDFEGGGAAEDLVDELGEFGGMNWRSRAAQPAWCFATFSEARSAKMASWSWVAAGR